MKKLEQIKTFIINLEKRPDRLAHIKTQFEKYKIFDTAFIRAKELERGTMGLWYTIKSIVSDSLSKGYPYIIIVEDDHLFLKDFNELHFLEFIEKARLIDAEILLGGVSWFDFTVKNHNGLNWINKFTGLQFTVLFKNFYEKIVNSELSDNEVTDKKISALSNKTYCIFPFISKQMEFGYSDVTIGNGESGKVDFYFNQASQRFYFINKIYDYYRG